MHSIVVIISANAEWRSIKALYPQARLEMAPVGEWFRSADFVYPLVFFHGGWGKVSASATAQYVIDKFQPDLLVNLGTCGGFEGRIQMNEVILVEKTIIYDIIEQMTDPDEAIEYYSTSIDLSWLSEELPSPVQKGLLVSADRDIVVEDIPMLIQRFGANAADWESGAIAWVAKRNHVRCLILRGVSDIVGALGDDVYGNIGLYRERTDKIMADLTQQLPKWLALLENG